jgi:hypothetical protein
MPKCEHCGKEVVLPYECSFCGHYFCVEHRLPENHNCPNLPPKTPLGPWKLESPQTELPKEEKTTSEGEFHFIKESAKEQEVEKPKPKGKLKYIIPIFCIILVLVSFTSYSFGYNNGSNSSFNTGYELGYTQGIIDGAGTSYNIREPTYHEMLNFIASDGTDKKQYSESYTCFNFAADVKNNAFKARFKCGFVYIKFPDSAHSIVCFNTTDHGLIFIEPQSDEIVTLTIGQPYWDRTKYLPPDYNDTILSFTIIW